MKYKKIMAFIFLAVCFLSIAGVCASDAGDMDVQTTNDTIESVVASEVDNYDVIASCETDGQDMVASSNENNVLNSRSFTDLQTLIGDTPEEGNLNLTEDYSLASGGDTVKISRSITINGNNHTLNGGGLKSILSIEADGKQIVLKNVIFENGKTSDGNGAALVNTHSSTTLTLLDCEFRNNHAGWYGGAVYSEGNLIIANSTFQSNQAEVDGGAVYCKGQTNIQTSRFKNNKAVGAIVHKCLGGAICSYGKCEIDSCIFDSNYAKSDVGGFGGAIYADNDLVINYNHMNDETSFSNNNASNCGGAIYACKDLYINWNSKSYTLKIEHNKAELDGGAIYCKGNALINNAFSKNNKAHKDGGVIFCEGQTTVQHSEFNGNSAIGNKYACFGGAIRSKGECDINSCTFNNNIADNQGLTAKSTGGAIYADKDLGIVNSYFSNNMGYYACAITCAGQSVIKNSEFNNHAWADFIPGNEYPMVCIIETIGKCDILSCTFKNNNGYQNGVIYSKAALTVTDSSFEKNSGKYGGAIYTDNEISIAYSSFINNTAGDNGGAISASVVTQVSNSVFLKNKANGTDGGAIYIRDKCNPQFVSCRFEENTCKNRGGAICINNEYSHLSVSYCTFVDNEAAANKGQSVYDAGYYNSVDMCWFGTNKPEFKDQFKIWHRFASEEDYKVTNYLKIAMKINETEFYKNNAYKTTVYFYAVNGAALDKVLLHSNGNFSGYGNFSNVKADVNDMTADVNLYFTGVYNIFGQLDHEKVSVQLEVNNKKQSEVHILACDDVKFPGQLSASYEISNMSGVATYVVRNSQGEIVKQGTLKDSSGLIIINYVGLSTRLDPGQYSITISHPETRTSLASSNTATYNILMGDMDLGIVVYNETYPDKAECIVRVNVDIGFKYNLTVTGKSGVVLSKMVDITHRVSHIDMGVLEGGNYTATISCSGYGLYNPASNSTRFEVKLRGVNFEVETNASEITYGETATISPIFSDAVTGTIRYYLHDGTFLDELPANENLTLPTLDAGFYVIIANYSGDGGHEAAFDSTHITVNQAKAAFKIDVNNVRYGETATVTHALQDVATGTIKYYLDNGTFLGELAVNETLVLPVFDVGSYVIIANYSGDNNFINATANVTLVISQVKTEIIVNPICTTYNSNKYLVITLKDINGNPVVGVTVTVDFNGIKNYTTDKSGQVKVSTNNIDVNTYDVAIIFNGTHNYINCSQTTKVIINKVPIKINAAPLKTVYNLYKYLMINLKDDLGNPIRNADTYITIHGVTYKCRTDSKGNAKLIIRLNPNTYTATIKFNNPNYNHITQYVKVTVIKATPKITAKKKTFKATKKVKKYTVVLKANGKAVPKVKLTLKIKGKTYKAKTNSKGKATFKIKKLTKKGKFKATIKFPGNIGYKKATKKVKIVIK